MTETVQLFESMNAPIESEVRRMRDTVYPVPIGDLGWKNCRDNWLRPENVAWLRREIARQRISSENKNKPTKPKQ